MKLTRIAYLLALIGGILIIIFGFLSLIGSAFLIFSPIAFLSGTVYAVVEMGIGFLCVIGSKYIQSLGWAIILLILGVIGGGIGGSLVGLGALIGIVANLFYSLEK